MGSENRVSSVPVWFQCWIGQYMEIIRTLPVYEKWKRYSDHMTYCYYLVHAKMYRAHIINKLKKYKTFCVLFYLFRCISNTILHRLYFFAEFLFTSQKFSWDNLVVKFWSLYGLYIIQRHEQKSKILSIFRDHPSILRDKKNK